MMTAGPKYFLGLGPRKLDFSSRGGPAAEQKVADLRE
jgi:hypothetical protein